MANKDAVGKFSDDYIHENIELVETDPFSDQLDTFDIGS